MWFYCMHTHDVHIGMSLKNHVIPANHPWGPGLTKELFYWTSGNDFQEFRNWKWGCGDQAEDLDWYMDESTNVTSPDNKMGNENCLVYTDKNSEKGFSGEDYDCDFKTGSIMCDTFPKCPVEEQYSMGTKGANIEIRL